MELGLIMQIFRDAIFTAFKIITPVLAAGMLIGLLIAVIQAATQIHEQTLTFVPKLFVVTLMLFLLGPWMAGQMSDFVYRLFEIMASSV